MIGGAGDRGRGILLFLAIAASSFACAHDMQILNLHEYEARASLRPPVRISVENGGGDYDERLLVGFVRDALQRHPAVERVFLHDEAPKDWDPDVIARIDPKTEYSGSGLNFLVTFPGFLVFAHAWNGFVYSANLETELLLSTPDGVEIGRRVLPSEYQLRHCGNRRGMLASSGWWTPFFGAINLVIGGFMVEYDQEATQPFLEDVRGSYGSYLANTIIGMLAADLPARSPSAEPATTPSESPLAPGPNARTTSQPFPPEGSGQEPDASP